MCPDIVETKLLNQREREWKPDPQVINKWTILYNLQKDYMERILPQIEATKKYDDVIHKKILKEKAEKDNLANLIQFQNKVNGDLQKSHKEMTTKFDSDKADDDQLLHYKHLQTVGPSKPSLTDFNKNLLDKMRQNQITKTNQTSKSSLNPTNKSILMKHMKNFLMKNGGFSFKEIPLENFRESHNSQKGLDNSFKSLSYTQGKIPESKIINEDLINYNINDEAVKSSVNFDKIVSGIKLNNGEKIKYLGTSVGSPYGGLNESTIKDKITKMNEEVGKPVINKVNFMNEHKQKKIVNKVEHKNFEQKFEAAMGKVKNSSHKEEVKINHHEAEPKVKEQKKIERNTNSVSGEKNLNSKDRKENNELNSNLSINTNQLKNNITKNRQEAQVKNELKLEKTEIEPATVFAQKSEKAFNINVPNVINAVENSFPNSFNNNFQRRSKFEFASDPVIDMQSEQEGAEHNKILNPPPISFLETSDVISFDRNLFNNLISKSNFNLETQRRGRRRSRFPDPQWDCAEAQIAKLVRYLCEEEVSASYQKYCKPIFEQINTMIESYLYHDNNLEVCQNIHMCPVTVDI
jgi:hypothetical protein